MELIPVGALLIVVGISVLGVILITARLIHQRREQLVGSEESVVPVNLASVNDAVIVARLGGQIIYANEVARQWFNLETNEPDLWVLAQRVKPVDAFYELFAAEGQASFTAGSRRLQASSHRVAVGTVPQFVVVIREEAALPSLSKEERGSGKALQVLGEITAALNAELELQPALDATLKSLERLIPHDAAQVCLWHQEQEVLRPLARAGQLMYTATTFDEDQAYRLDEGLTGWVARRRKPLRLADVAQQDEVLYIPRLTDPKFSSYLGVPLTVRSRFIGTLEIMAETPGRFDADDEGLLLLFAEQAAIAIENARRYSSQAERVEELAGLQRIAGAISWLRDPYQFYAQLSQRIAELMDTEMCGVLLYDAEGESLVAQRPMFGVTDALAGRYEIPLAKGSPAYSLWEDVTFWFSNNVGEEPLVAELDLSVLTEMTGVRTTAMAAMTLGGVHLGVLQVSNKKDGKPFTLEDIRLLQLYAEQAAILVESARLYSEGQSRVAELEGLQQITQSMTALTNPEQLYDQLTGQIADLLQVTICGLLLYEPDDEKLAARVPFYGVEDEIAAQYQMPVNRRGLARDLWREYNLFVSNEVGIDVRMEQLGIRDVVREAEMQTLMFAPLIAGGRRFGLLQVANKYDSSDFDANDQRLLAIFAGQAATLIENARLYQDTDATLSRRAGELRSVSRISRELNATLELERILEVIAAEALKAEGADYGSLITFRWKDDRSDIVPTAVFGADLRDQARVLELAAIRRGEIITIDDFDKLDNFPRPMPGTRSALLVPIHFEGRIVGLISLYGTKPGALGASAAEFVQALSSQATIAVTNATRHAEQVERSELLRSRAEQLTRIFELSRAFRSDQSVQDNLDAVARAIQDAVGFQVVLLSFSGEDGLLRNMAQVGLGEAEAGRVRAAASEWSQAEAFFDPAYRMSECYIAPYNESAPIYSALGLDVPQTRDEQLHPGEWQPGTIMLTPLRGSDGKPLGLIAVDQPRDEMLPSRNAVELLEIFANQASIIMENSRLYRSAQERAEELSASLTHLERSYAELDKLSDALMRKDAELSVANELLNLRAQRLLAIHRVMESLDTTRPPGEVLQTLVDSIVTEMDVDQALLAVYHNGGERAGGLRVVAASGKLPQGVDFTALIDGADPLSQAHAKHDVVMIQPGRPRSELMNFVKAIGAQTLIALPMQLEAGQPAVLAVGITRPGAAFNEDDRDLFTLVGSQIAVEYENARLYQAVQQEAATAAAERDRLQQLHVITTALQQTDSLEDRLRVIARGIRSVGWGRVAVALLDDQMGIEQLATAGYPEGSEAALRQSILSGSIWQRRFEDPQLAALRIGSSYYLPHDHPWVRSLARGGSNGSSRIIAAPPKDTPWHPEDQLYLPMYSGMQIVGLVALTDPVTGTRPEEADLRPLELFVQQATSALENIRLYRETMQLQSYNEAVVQSIQQGIIVTDAQGQIETVNAFISQAYGWGQDALGSSLFAFQPLLRQIGLEEDFNQALASREPVVRNNLALEIGSQGENRITNISIYPRFDKDQGVNGAVILLEDITRRVRLEEDIALRGQQLAALSDISRKVTSTLSFQQIVDSIGEQAREVVEYDEITVYLLDPLSMETRITFASRSQGRRDALSGVPQAALDALREQVQEQQSPLLIEDLHSDARVPSGAEYPTRSWLCVPLAAGGNMLGAVVFERAAAQAYAPADIKVAEAYATQIAVALENARLFEEVTQSATQLSRRSQRLAMLNRISATIGRSLDQGSILQTALDELVEALECSRGAVVMLDRDVQLGHQVALHPSPVDGTPPPPRTFSLAGSRSMEKLRVGQPVAVDDVGAEPGDALLSGLFEGRSGAGLLLPLILANNIIGLLAVEREQFQYRFTEEQVELAQTITNQTASAVQNARLYGETVSRQRELGILFEASRIASASLDLKTVVENAAGYFARALDVDGAMISLWDREHDSLLPLIDFNVGGGLRPLTERDHRANLGQFPALASVLKERGALVLNASNPAISDEERAWLAYKQVGTALLLPLVARDEAIGLAELWSSKERSHISQNEIRFGRALAASLATAMENARLHDETAQRLQELAVINEISRTLTGAISPEDLFRALESQLSRVLKAPSITLVRTNARGDRLEFPLAVREGKRVSLAAAPAQGTLYAQVMQTGQPLLISRGVKQYLKQEKLTHPQDGLRSALLVPLAMGERVTGLLAVEDYKQEGTFDQASLRVLGPLAAQVAVSLENTRLYSELEQRLSETTTLQEVSRVIASLDLNEVFSRVVTELDQAFTYPLIGLFRLEGRELVLKAQRGHTPEQAAVMARRPLEEGIMGRAVVKGEPQFIEDVTGDPDYIPMHDWVTCMIAVPIISDEFVLGVLTVQSGADRPLTVNDLSLLRTFAGQVAAAMVNASLYTQMVDLSEELERRVEERTEELRSERDRINTLYRITVELSASLDLDRVLNQALKLVGTAIGAEHGSLFLIDPQSDNLIYRAAMSDFVILPPGGKQLRISRHEGLAGWVMDNRQSVLIDNVQDDPRWSNLPGTEERRSTIGTPLVHNEEVLGCLFFNSDQESIFQSGHLQLVQAAANQVATAINNAELYRLIRDQAEKLGGMLRSQQTEAAKSQSILESVADGVMVSDQTGEIILFNAAAERILELKREEVLGRPSHDLTGLYGAGAESWEKMLAEWSANPEHYEGQFFSERLEFGNKIVSVYVSPVLHGDEYLGLVSVFRDITAEVLADRLKSEFVARVSHELRTPMTSIKGYADLLLMGAAGEVSAEQRRFLDTIKSNADRLSLLVNDLLDISRLEQRGVDLDLNQIDVVEIIHDVVLALQGRLSTDKREMNIETDLQADQMLVYGDYDRVTQVLTNLVNNAYQYTEDGGTITVRARYANSGVQVDVTDTGIGIPEKDQSMVFDRFFRGEDNPLVFQTAGTGLGLSIVKQLIEMHRGRIWLESTVGQGSTFSFWLPGEVN